MDICIKCNLEYDPIRWENCPKLCAAKGKRLNTYGGGYFVCDKCLDDKIRHKIIENFLGYEKEIITTEKFTQLLYFLNFSTRFDFYNWFMRESSKYYLYDLSLYGKLKTTSAYPIPIKHLMNYICNTHKDEFVNHMMSKLNNYTNAEKKLIKSSTPISCKY